MKSEEMNNNQINQGWGGKREGAGRPQGSSKKPKITDYLTDEEIDEMVCLYISQCREKSDLMKHLMDLIFGKPRQNIGLDGGEDNKPISILRNVISGNDGAPQDSQTEEEN